MLSITPYISKRANLCSRIRTYTLILFLTKICCAFPYFCTFICHHPKPRTWCLVSSAERTALNFSVNAYGDLSSSKHVIVVTVCFAATDIYSSFTIFTPHRYSLRFIRILTVTLSVTHKYSTITTCLGVPTTLYPHYCRHASTQDCS